MQRHIDTNMDHNNVATDLALTQGTPEWLSLRKTKITATDARVIMGADPWKTRWQLYQEKTSDISPTYKNARMQRGLDLEDEARQLFIIQTGINVFPNVIVKDWAMASLDGINCLGNVVVEIKCPGEKDHAIALSGKVPDHYYPQLQHQMYVCDVNEMDYFSYDGLDGVIVKIQRDDNYIAKMLVKELEFYECLINRTTPEPGENDYIERNDTEWMNYAQEWKLVKDQMKQLEKKEENIKNELIKLSGELKSKGSGVSLSKITRQGNINYSIIPEIKNIDLEPYRKKDSFYWKINELSAT